MQCPPFTRPFFPIILKVLRHIILPFPPKPNKLFLKNTSQLSSRENNWISMEFNVKPLREQKIKYWCIPQKIKTPPTSHSLLCGLQFHPGFPKEAKSIWRAITTWSINWTNDTVPLSPEMDASSWARMLPRNEKEAKHYPNGGGNLIPLMSVELEHIDLRDAT